MDFCPKTGTYYMGNDYKKYIMSKTYELSFSAETINHLLDSVDKKSIYPVATEAEIEKILYLNVQPQNNNQNGQIS